MENEKLILFKKENEKLLLIIVTIMMILKLSIEITSSLHHSNLKHHEHKIPVCIRIYPIVSF